MLKKTIYEGSKTDGIVSQFELEQLTQEPINITGDASCVDLVFIFKPSLVVELAAHPSFHHNCHCHIVYARFNLHISITNAKFGT